ncbi:hypothetical protein NQ318_014739 [Aromia moschata]|uniref:C2H2-type domain-containing protein n=1 Tax=Aromia moschata TaxID=1265417 RepID=A0AAV8ZAU7_9CUCU|nr:hypothetical protein NQ318_014739 [Aromia moschata]
METKPPVTRLECTMCKKTFPTVHTLNIHKRSHVKENLVNATTVTKVSPKKAQPRASTSSRPKSPRRTTAESRGTFKCKECLRVCYSQESLARHEKTHRKYRCPTCAATFPSRLLLDEHIRVKCVKTASPSNKRLSFKIRKSYVHSPRRKSVKPTQKANPPNTNNTTENAKMTLGVKLECSACGETFPRFKTSSSTRLK